ncbi:P-loop containing nucleoside triphosphate hydrolase protein [Rhodotorula diobovata]|uniref:P-loop containing nucleoside triphosphate hydrolase protein n=1 Tax=Rhodotorula diobovata TaxID=5288 RepID=A0A5C5FXP9_9BASI|nr:P-loop containing nucleoside triphosphate hydrolase protein [Rhodotorula diobovata]
MADPSQGTTTAAPTAAQLATQGVAPSAPTVAPGATIEGSHEAHVESTLAGNLSKTSDGQPKTTGVEHAPQAPSPSPPSPPSRSSSSGHETIAPLKSNTSESIDEKVVERMQAQKIKEEAHGAEEDGEGGADGEGEGKGSKKKKGKPFFDKRTPLEIALEDPELAHLSPEYRKVVAEQIATIKRPPCKFSELFRYTTKLELFMNAIGLICAIAAGVAQPAMTILFGNLTTAFTDYGRLTMVNAQNATPELIAQARSNLFREVNKDVLILVYIGIATFVATWVYMFTWIYSGETTTRRIRERYLRAVMRQNIAYFDRVGAGAITTRIETDTHLIQEGISDKVVISVQFIAIFIAGFVIAIVRNWRLALVCSVIIPCIAIAGGAMNAFISKYKAAQLEATAKASTLAEEVISSVRIAQAFGTQKRLTESYDESNQETLRVGLKSARFNGLGLGVFFFIIYASYGLAFYYGTTLILQGRATSGEVINVFFSILIGAFSLAQLAPNLQAISFAKGAATEIYATIDRIPIIDSASEEGLKPDHVEGKIELEAVEMVYPARPGAQVLYNFNGVFPPGKMTALVGGSGSGKSTIIGLLERFYDPVAGIVKLDDIPLKDLNVKWLRNQIGLVSQEPTLFATTVAGNIEHGMIGSRFEHETGDARRKRVIEAAKLANADGFIQALPHGYDTQIGERGMLLSGGQKQRIAIARAIVSDPKILLLDEATSALDTNSEAIVQDALDRASAGRTTITVAHRLSTIRDADQIIVLTAGHILESAMTTDEGTAHTRLLRNPEGAYSKLVAAQKIREEEAAAEAEADDDEADHAPVPGELTREQIDEMARREKPQFEQLKRAGTGRSLASEVLERRQDDIEAAGGDLPKHYSTFTLFARMYKLNREYWRRYVFAFMGAVASGCVYPVFGIVFGGVVSTFQLDPETQGGQLRREANRYALWCFVIAILSTLAVIVQSWMYGDTAERLSAKIRLNTFKSTLRQDIAFFDRDENSTGTLTNSITDRATKIFGLFGQTQGVIIQSLFTLVAGAIIGLCYSWKIALVGIACMPLTLSAGIVRLRVVVLKDEKNKKSHAQSAQMACEAAGAIRTVAALTRENDCLELYSHQLDLPMRESNRVAVWSNAFYSLTQALSFFVIALIFWFGASQMVDSGLSVNGFFVAQISVVFASIQAGNVFAYTQDASSFFGAARAFLALEDAKPDIDAEDPTGKQVDLATAKGHIRFENVHFRYPTRPHVPVLRGLDVEVLPGQMAAFVGASGCGKSTSIQLIERFYDPLGGKVIVDGQDISELNIQSYRKSIALVSQEPTLYAGSIRYNVALGAYVPPEQVTQEQIEQACKDANIHNLISSLPDGYDTEVGGKGTMLSGGQKQRIAIARALIRNPKILLLDEATSALDSESERVVQRALDEAAKNRTTIAIAHRLSTIQNADVIFVLKDGRVAEKGTHSQLIAHKGLYFELVAQQSLEKT